MKQALAAAALAGVLAMGGLAGCASEHARMSADGKTRVVIQVSDNDPAKWNLALNNAQNLQQRVHLKHTWLSIESKG